MMNKKNLAVALSVVFLVAVVSLGGLYDLANGSGQTPNTGVIEIDAMHSFVPLERPAVRFPHDTHTAAPSFQDCNGCHRSEDRKGFSFAEMPEGVSKRAAMDTWHKACMDCHKDLVKNGERSGPMTCGECHPKGEREPLAKMPAIGFYDAYHDFHMETLSGGCEQCHHDYDANTGELYYAEGSEAACVECHGESPDGDTPSIKDASHLSCIQCHVEMAAGPVACGECHQ